jgi:7-alpha-hydroxysteroid dehydrogenase
MNIRLDGKVAIVTGGGRGLGKAIAMALADAGADVAISGRKLQDLEKVADEARRFGKKCLPVSAHARKVEELKNLVDKVMEALVGLTSW